MKTFILDNLNKYETYNHKEISIFLKFYSFSGANYKKILEYKFPNKKIEYPGSYILEVLEMYGEKTFTPNEAVKIINEGLKGFDNRPVKKDDLDLPIFNLDIEPNSKNKIFYKKKDVENFIRNNRFISLKKLAESGVFRDIKVKNSLIKQIIMDLKIINFISDADYLRNDQIFYKDLTKIKRIILEQKGYNNEK